ncbi:MAG: hypothetical protein K6A71_04715 [Lachnospiraceae bacterium]|nr:hypothetical protein [Lachnospiraceae bacterium]
MAGFFDDQDREDKKAYKRAVVYFVAATSLVMLLFLTIVYINTKDKQERRRALARQEQQEREAMEEAREQERLEEEALGIGESNMTSEDLEFWGMYEKKDTIPEAVSSNAAEEKRERPIDDDKDKDKDKAEDKDKTVSDNKTDRDRKDNEDSIEMTGEEKEEIRKSEDGKHIKAKAKGEDLKWYDIEEDAEMNTYDLKAALSMDEDKLEYTYGTIYTKRGVDVSKYQGDIDWSKVKAAGYDFAMIRVGARGYGSGNLVLDDNFVPYITGARNAGLETGVYFFSQAVTEEEAVEEANFTVGALLNYGVTYPIAIDIEWIEDDKARTDKLTPMERTELAVKFCDTVKSFGYTPMIYASRDMLIAGMHPDLFEGYEVWLSDDYRAEGGTDYPYSFTMWQYNKKGKVDGIAGDVDLNLRFINRKEK